MVRLCSLLLMTLLFIGAKPVVYLEIVKPDEVPIKETPWTPVSMDDVTYYGKSTVAKIKDVIGKRESKNQYHIVNAGGCMGKYQFFRSTLRTLGYSKEEIKNFLVDTVMQEEAMVKLLEHNYNWLKRNKLLRFNNTVVGDTKITTEGMLAACHLLGGASLKDYLLTGGSMREYFKTYASGKCIYIRKKDSNTTTIKEYLNLFQRGYTGQRAPKNC